MSAPSSLQMVGSKALGGAERWFLRFGHALAERGAPAELAVRAGSQLDRGPLPALPVHRLPFLTVWDPVSRGAVSRLVRRLKPDIVQTYMGRATRLARLAPGKGSVHIARLGGYYRLHPYRRAHAWIGNTRGLCDWLVRSGLPAARVFHIYNFVDPARPVAEAVLTRLRAELGLPADAWVLMTPGRFVPVKGHRYLLEALARAPREIAGRPLHLLLLGEGTLEERLRSQVRENGTGARVIWAGWRTDPAPFYQLADLIVFPSLEEETLGNVILEAWAWSKPLVTSLFRGAREIARPGEDAWCVPCADARALAEGIEAMLRDPALGAEMAARGHRRVEMEFGREAIMGQYLELYRRLAGG
jgi:L-malate glycosyltransferase